VLSNSLLNTHYWSTTPPKPFLDATTVWDDLKRNTIGVQRSGAMFWASLMAGGILFEKLAISPEYLKV